MWRGIVVVEKYVKELGAGKGKYEIEIFESLFVGA